MTKKRSKILILSALIALVMIALAVTAVFAYNIIIDYNYNFTANDSVLTIGMTDSTSLYVKRTDGKLKASKADIVLISEEKNLTLDLEEPSHSAEFKQGDDTYYTHVFRNMPLDSSSETSTTFTTNEPISAVVKAAISEGEYTESGINTITYQNAYVSSFFELQLLNFQSNYNNVFELAGNYYGKIVYSRTVFVIADFAITEDLSINHPCSINILNSNLTLNANLTVHHSYAGAYYIETETVNGFGTGTMSGAGRLSVKTPKAFYSINAVLRSTLLGASRLSETYDFVTYGNLVLSDALGFAKALIPQRTFSDVILQPMYQTFGVEFSYYVVGDGGNLSTFTGGVSTTAREGSILRTVGSKVHKIRVYASKGAAAVYADVEMQVVGTNTESIFGFVFDVITDAYLPTGKIFSSIDLLPIFGEVYGVGGYTEDITLSFSESLSLDITDHNAFKLVLDGVEADSVDITSAGILAAETFILKRGDVPISTDLTLKLESASGEIVKTLNIDIEIPTKNETIYFLKTEADTFTTNKKYGVYSIGGLEEESGLYEGVDKLIDSNLGLKEITYEIVSINEDDTNDIIPTDRFFDIYSDGLELRLVLEKDLWEGEIFLLYTVVFLDGSIEYIYLPIILSLADDGGENQQFESSNPFDPLFMSEEINWLNGGEFEVSQTDEIYYAYIEITHINGEEYTPANPYYKMCYIDYVKGPLDAEYPEDYYRVSDLTGQTYYKKINFVTDLKYVPDKNITVKVMCYYWAYSIDDVSIEQDYTITVKGIYKCGDVSTQAPDETPYVFSDRDFYDMTIKLIQYYYPDSWELYASELDNDELMLLSDSSDSRPELDYRRFTQEGEDEYTYTGGGVVTTGIELLANVPTIIMDGIIVADMSSFELLVGSSLKTLSLANCKLTDAALYQNGASQSYIYEVQLTTVILKGNALTRTDKLLSRTVTYLDISNQTNNLGVKVLISVDGLASIKELVTLDISNNAIYRFEVLKEFKYLKKVYLYNNRLDEGANPEFTVYGTDGYINIPHYVWLIKTNKNMMIFANENNLKETGIIGYLILGVFPGLFSRGGNILPSMQEGSIALNSFAASTQIFDDYGKTKMEYDYNHLVLSIIGDFNNEVGGGVDEDTSVTDYYFRFYDFDSESLETTFVFLKDYETVLDEIHGTVLNPVTCTYILSIVKVVEGAPDEVIAMREFKVNIYYEYIK